MREIVKNMNKLEVKLKIKKGNTMKVLNWSWNIYFFLVMITIGCSRSVLKFKIITVTLDIDNTTMHIQWAKNTNIDAHNLENNIGQLKQEIKYKIEKLWNKI